MYRSPSFVGLAPLLALASSAHAQQQRWSVHADERTEFFGECVVWIDDIDGDGVPDVAASARQDPIDPPDPRNPNDDDRVRVLSGADLSLLYELRRDDDADFGIALARCGDFDADGIDDLLVAQARDAHGAGVASVFSAATGALLREFRAPDAVDWTDAALATLDDVDGDGLGEIVLGLPLVDHGSGALGTLRVVASSDGATLAEWHGDDWRGLGRRKTFCILDDADLDGRRDLAIVDGDGTFGSDFVVTIHSGATFAPIVSKTISKPGFDLGSIGATGDVNADSRSDVVLVVVKNSTFKAMDAYALNGRNLATIWLLPMAWGEVTGCRPVGDANQDGRGDFAISLIYDQGANFRIAHFDVCSGKDGSRLYFRGGYTFDPSWETGPRFALPDGEAPDLDGDGKPELLYGFFDTQSNLGADSRVAVHTQQTGWDLLARTQRRELRHLHGLAIADDVDADGWNDVRTLEVSGTTRSDRHDRVATRSGRDGTLLREVIADELVCEDFDYSAFDFCGTWSNLVTVPDLDGDSRADYVVTRLEWPDLVLEARSGSDDSLVAEIREANWARLELVHAIGLDPATGTARLALSDPENYSSGGLFNAGEVRVYDLSTGTRAWTHHGTVSFAKLGFSLAWVTDVDGDGFADLAAGAPDGAGRVALLSGSDGSEIGSIPPPSTGFNFGAALASLPDVDGDGIDDLLVGYPGEDPDGHSPLPGALVALRGGDWDPLFTIRADGSTEQLGQDVAWAPDANGDGAIELFGAAPGWGWSRLQVDLFSALDGSRLERMADLAIERPTVLVTGAPWLPADDGGVATRLVGGMNAFGKEITFFTLPDLFLTIAPEVAAPGESVAAELRGGPPHAFAGLYLTAVDDLPLEAFLAFGVLDGRGAWTVIDTVPPGIVETAMTLRAYAVGFDGRLARSDEKSLEFR